MNGNLKTEALREQGMEMRDWVGTEQPLKKHQLLSVIVPVCERYDDIRALYGEYVRYIEQVKFPYEFVFILDGPFPDVASALERLSAENDNIRVVQLSRGFGEAVALTAGFEHSSGDLILTLPAYFQISPKDIKNVLAAVNEYDLIVARRWPRRDPWINKIQGKVFHWLLNTITGTSFTDLGSGVRVFKRKVIEELQVYGDQHRFLPVLASRQGFRVKEVDVSQAENDKKLRVYRFGVYPRRMLDILTVFFLVKFTKKPLRFFGLIGAGVGAIGFISLIYVVFQRFFLGIGLADRPALLLSTLAIVLGIQIFAIGLIGELIIFTHAKDLKEYSIEKIIN
jgi:glycosyltransferase involved in cell wall biosynthesis